MSPAHDTQWNEVVIARLPDLLRDLDSSAIRSCFTEDFRLHDPLHPDWPPGHDGAVRMFVRVKSLMPDVMARIEDMFGEGDNICVRWRFKGTLTGSFEQQKGDGRRIETITFTMYRFRDGRIAEEFWGTDAFLPEDHPWRAEV